jgi:hypothetical protein
MTYNLFDLTYRVVRELGIVTEGTVTGGTTTTTIDTGYLGYYPDDWFNYGTLWLLYDAGGAGAAPEGEWARVTDFTNSTKTITHEALTVAPAAGDRYAVAPRKLARETLVQQINSVLQEILVPVEDIYTITIAAGQAEYPLPNAVLDQGIEVYLQTILNDPDNFGWEKNNDWYIRDPGAGYTKYLVFKNIPATGRGARVVYWIPHAPLNARTDQLQESVSLERVVLGASVRCLEWLMKQPGTVDGDLPRQLQIMQARLVMYTPASRRRMVKLMTLGTIDTNGAA